MGTISSRQTDTLVSQVRSYTGPATLGGPFIGPTSVPVRYTARININGVENTVYIAQDGGYTKMVAYPSTQDHTQLLE